MNLIFEILEIMKKKFITSMSDIDVDGRWQAAQDLLTIDGGGLGQKVLYQHIEI